MKKMSVKKSHFLDFWAEIRFSSWRKKVLSQAENHYKEGSYMPYVHMNYVWTLLCGEIFPINLNCYKEQSLINSSCEKAVGV